MASGETALSFGVMIRTWQLIVAARALKRFSPLLEAIDIIILRQRSGTLEIAGEPVGAMGIGHMPVEVLEMIRGGIFGEGELEGAARRTFDGNRSRKSWKQLPKPPRNWDDLHDAYYDRLCDIQVDDQPIGKQINALLAYYGLKLATSAMGNEEDDDSQMTDESTSIIALPSSITRIYAEAQSEYGTRSCGAVISPQLSKTLHYQQAPNFRRLFQDFPFDVVPNYPSEILPLPEPARPSTSDSLAAKPKHPVLKSEWIVFMSCEASY